MKRSVRRWISSGLHDRQSRTIELMRCCFPTCNECRLWENDTLPVVSLCHILIPPPKWCSRRYLLPITVQIAVPKPPLPQPPVTHFLQLRSRRHQPPSTNPVIRYAWLGDPSSLRCASGRWRCWGRSAGWWFLRGRLGWLLHHLHPRPVSPKSALSLCCTIVVIEQIGDGLRTNLIELDDVWFRVQLAQECLRGFAVGAPGFAEDGWGCVNFRPSVLGYFLILVVGCWRGFTYRRHSHQWCSGLWSLRRTWRLGWRTNRRSGGGKKWWARLLFDM